MTFYAAISTRYQLCIKAFDRLGRENMYLYLSCIFVS